MFILTGRGARMREGQPKKEGRRSFVAYLPSLLGFSSHALPFLTLSSLLRFTEFLVLPMHQLHKGSAEQGGQGVRKAGARGRKPRGIGEISRLRRIPLSLWVVTPVPWGEMTHVIEWSKLGQVIPANSDLS